MAKAKALQFGLKVEGRDYLDRPTVFGIALKDGKLACVRVTKPKGAYIDLPGGAIDPGETEAAALIREFAEETGLKVQPSEAIACASQYMLKSDGRAVNNVCAFWTAEVVSGPDPALKVEADHDLVWLAPEEALLALRYDAYAWALLAWMRRGGA